MEWASEDLSAFLGEMLRKLCDITITSSGAQRAFFYTMEMKTTFAWEGFSLAWLNANYSSDDDFKCREFQRVLFVVQHNMLNYFMDKFRTLGSEQVSGLLQAIPFEWWNPTICRQGQCARKTHCYCYCLLIAIAYCLKLVVSISINPVIIDLLINY